jgi:hypothetical protein
MAIGYGQTPSNLKPIAASAPPPGVETPGYPQKPVKTGSRAHFLNLL